MPRPNQKLTNDRTIIPYADYCSDDYACCCKFFYQEASKTTRGQRMGKSHPRVALLQLKPDEIGWVKYSIIRTTTQKELTKQEVNLLWRILSKIEKQEKREYSGKR